MDVSMLEQLQAIDLQLLTTLVRQDQQSPTFVVTDWRVEHLSTKGIVNPDGLFLFRGTGMDEQGNKPWSIVLKILRRSEAGEDLRNIWYWKRELLAAQHRLLADLPGPVVAPRIYLTSEHHDSAWLWMEHIVPSSSTPWTLEHYAIAAYALGRFNARYLTDTPMPDYPWLCSEHCYWWLAGIEALEPDKAWDNTYVRAVFSDTLRAGVEQIWADKALLLSVLSRVPQVFSHFDAQRRNLFLRTRDEQNEVVAVDWAFAGRGALGGDLFALVGSTAILYDVEPEVVPALEVAAFEAYLRGLRDTGWQGNADLVRLGYAAWFALWIGAAAPAATAAWTSGSPERVQQQFGRGPEAATAGWAYLCELALHQADTAQRLMHRVAFE